MVDSEFVAAGTETQARLTDLGEGGLVIHCSNEETEALLAKPGARPFEICGREMKGRLRVDAESVSTKQALEPWAMQSVAFARALPPKEKK
jgi:hypothetical protein